MEEELKTLDKYKHPGDHDYKHIALIYKPNVNIQPNLKDEIRDLVGDHEHVILHFLHGKLSDKSYWPSAEQIRQICYGLDNTWYFRSWYVEHEDQSYKDIAKRMLEPKKDHIYLHNKWYDWEISDDMHTDE